MFTPKLLVKFYNLEKVVTRSKSILKPKQKALLSKLFNFVSGKRLDSEPLKLFRKKNRE